jgi:hypothetical protein
MCDRSRTLEKRIIADVCRIAGLSVLCCVCSDEVDGPTALCAESSLATTAELLRALGALPRAIVRKRFVRSVAALERRIAAEVRRIEACRFRDAVRFDDFDVRTELCAESSRPREAPSSSENHAHFSASQSS